MKFTISEEELPFTIEFESCLASDFDVDNSFDLIAEVLIEKT